MDLRTDVKSQWRDRHHKAVWLQSQWQEVSERERRAQIFNRKLLQDFQRAQDTLSDLVARTEAMNTIRVEYERYLEQNFPQWQQKLKDKRLSEQRKRIEEHLQACIEQMEQDQRISGGKTSPVTSSSSLISPLHPPISHLTSDTVQCKEKRGEGHFQKSRSTLSKQDNKQNLQNIFSNDSQHLYVPFTWSSETEPQLCGISKQTKTSQNSHQVLNSAVFLPADQRHGPYPVIQHEQSYSGHFPQHIKPWTGGVQCAPSGAPYTGIPVNPLVWNMLRMSEAEKMGCSEEKQEENWRKESNSEPKNHQTRKQRRKLEDSDCSSKLGSNSAHPSDSHEHSSVSSALSSGAVNILRSPGTQKTQRLQRRKETWTLQSSSGGEDRVQQRSSSKSDGHSDTNNKKDKFFYSSPASRTAVKTRSKAQAINISGPESQKHLEKEREQEDNDIRARSTDSSTAMERKKKRKTRKGTKKNEDESAEEKHLTEQEEQVSKDGEESKVGEEDERDDVSKKQLDGKVRSKGLCEKRRNGGGGSESECLSGKEVEKKGEREQGYGGVEEEHEDGGEEDEEEDGDIKDKDGGEEVEDDSGDVDEEENNGGEEEEDDGEEEEDDGEEEDDKGEEDGAEEMSAEVRRQIKGGDEENDSEAAASDSRKNVCDSLKEMYKDEDKEDDVLYDQEIEDDIEDDEDDDDDVVVEKAYPWTCGPVYNYAKYQDDEDDEDVEGLLAPQINVEQHQSDERKEILHSKGEHKCPSHNNAVFLQCLPRQVNSQSHSSFFQFTTPTFANSCGVSTISRVVPYQVSWEKNGIGMLVAPRELLQDLRSDSEEGDSQRKPVSAPVKEKHKDGPVGSDDEFDHFYD